MEENGFCMGLNRVTQAAFLVLDFRNKYLRDKNNVFDYVLKHDSLNLIFSGLLNPQRQKNRNIFDVFEDFAHFSSAGPTTWRFRPIRV